MRTKIKNIKSWVAGIFTAVAASLCCMTPVLAFLGGASGLSSSFSWIEPFRPYLISLTIAVFAFAWYQKLKPQKQVDCDCESDNKKSFWQSKLFLAIVTVVAGLLITFPYYAKVFYPKPKHARVVIVDKSNIQTVEFKIKGMTCEGCTVHINSELSKTSGVIEYNTSYEKGNSLVKFDNSKTSVDSLVSVINKTGYKITSQSVINN
ncbi:mercuric transport protein MerTP [Sediminibacterium sp.]|uniref:mercuric transport protein MerTP n=1 Tax=Sediminibacterium sp. TaxID=1917865 RepID=UPI0025F3E18C|nr:mercuric transport protein MerTP [Sediminibacterium sp.]MBW0177104.1 mercuric transport protein MerTP [Sediminibacterium sp.]